MELSEQVSTLKQAVAQLNELVAAGEEVGLATFDRFFHRASF